MRRFLPLLVALGAVAAVVVPYVALGGATFEPTPVADPCETREDLVLAIRDEDALDAFAAEHGITREDAERAVQDGLERAIDDAEEAGALPGFLAGFARRAADAVPPWLLLETLERLGGLLP